MKTKHTSPEQLFDMISQFVSESQGLLKQGALMELTGLDQRVKELCELILKLSQSERQRYSDQLQKLLGDLNELSKALIEQRDTVAADIRTLSDHQKANVAYRAADATDDFGKPKK